jgi:hypothetical protein
VKCSAIAGSEKSLAQAASFLASRAVWQGGQADLEWLHHEATRALLVALLESQLEGNGTPSMELAGAGQFASFDLDALKIGR